MTETGTDLSVFAMRRPPEEPEFDASHPDYWDWSEYDRYIRTVPWLRAAVEFHAYKGKTLLEIGFGTGIDLFSFARRGAAVVGVDISPAQIHLTQRRFRAGRQACALVLGDAKALPLADHAFDLVYVCDVLTHTPHQDAILREIRRVLKPGCNALIIESVALCEQWPRHTMRGGPDFAQIDPETPKAHSCMLASEAAEKEGEGEPRRPYTGRLAPWFYRLWYVALVTAPQLIKRMTPVPLRPHVSQHLACFRQPVARMFTYWELRLGRGLIPLPLKEALGLMARSAQLLLWNLGGAIMALVVKLGTMTTAPVLKLHPVRHVVVVQLHRKLRMLRWLSSSIDDFRADRHVRSHLLEDIGFCEVDIFKRENVLVLRLTR